MRMLDALLNASPSVAQMLSQRRESQPRDEAPTLDAVSADRLLGYYHASVAQAFRAGATSLHGRGADDPSTFGHALTAFADDYADHLSVAFEQAVRDCITNPSRSD